MLFFNLVPTKKEKDEGEEEGRVIFLMWISISEGDELIEKYFYSNRQESSLKVAHLGFFSNEKFKTAYSSTTSLKLYYFKYLLIRRKYKSTFFHPSS